jgi:hypothetical protein
MATTLLNAEVALSKEIGDYWESTTTANGAADGTTLIDTALKAKADDWITDEAYDMITSGSQNEEERKISSLDSSTGTLTILAHGGQILSDVTYRVHRLFEASEKRRALVAAARNVYPALFAEIWNEELVSGNWLSDGSLERWTNSTTPSEWTATSLTATQITTSPYYKHGSTSAKLSGAAGTLSQAITNFDDLKYLAGRNVVFSAQVWCDTASAVRLSIDDGITQTYSEYHAGDSAWTNDEPRTDGMYVQQFIDYNATRVTFTVHLENAAATAYVDDLRVISDYRSRLYIGHLGLAQNRPHQVLIEPANYSQQEEWIKVHGWRVDPDGYLYIPSDYPSDYRLRIRGIGYLDFLLSGASSTDWSATIDIDEPQVKILVAEAAYWLYTWKSMPNYERGDRAAFQQVATFWRMEADRRKAQFGMRAPGATVDWGVR